MPLKVASDRPCNSVRGSFVPSLDSRLSNLPISTFAKYARSEGLSPTGLFWSAIPFIPLGELHVEPVQTPSVPVSNREGCSFEPFSIVCGGGLYSPFCTQSLEDAGGRAGSRKDPARHQVDEVPVDLPLGCKAFQSTISTSKGFMQALFIDYILLDSSPFVCTVSMEVLLFSGGRALISMAVLSPVLQRGGSCLSAASHHTLEGASIGFSASGTSFTPPHTMCPSVPIHPSFLNSMVGGQIPVTADWAKFAPTKRVPMST